MSYYQVGQKKRKNAENVILSSVERKTVADALAEQLRALRATLGLSQREVADIAGLALTTYGQIERKERELTWRTFLALLMFFNYNPYTQKMIKDAGIISAKLDRWLCVYRG